MKERIKEKHPSYAIAKFARISGGGRSFFGTPIKPDHYIELEISQGYKEVDEFGREHFQPIMTLPLISVKMTSNQFSELITTMNIGQGIPVTLTELDRKPIEECPSQTSPVSNAIEKATDGVKESKKQISDWLLEIDDIVKTSTLSEKKKAEIIRRTGLVDGRLDSSAEFYQQRVLEVGEKVTQQVKTEIEATTTAVIHQLGLKSLSDINKLS